jgi:hypothetical protein
MASIGPKRPDGTYRGRYRDAAGKEHARHFSRNAEAKWWLDTQTAKLVTGTWVDPKTAKITVDEWCETWLAGFATQQTADCAPADVHIAKIIETFGARRLDSIRPSEVKSWTAAPAASSVRCSSSGRSAPPEPRSTACPQASDSRLVALLRLAADQLGRRRQGGAGPTAARLGQDHL